MKINNILNRFLKYENHMIDEWEVNDDDSVCLGFLDYASAIYVYRKLNESKYFKSKFYTPLLKNHWLVVRGAK